jgi:hypothetical protein
VGVVGAVGVEVDELAEDESVEAALLSLVCAEQPARMRTRARVAEIAPTRVRR